MFKSKTIHFNIHADNRGQALLFVVVALTISMVVGVSVATRTLSVTKRVSSTDTQAKVFYAAEAGVERFVDLPASELDAIAAVGSTSCGTTQATRDVSTGDCVFRLGTGSNIETKTSVTVEAFTFNETTPRSHYSVKLSNGTFSTIALVGYPGGAGNPLSLCWRNQPEASTDDAAIYYSLWSDTSLLSKALVVPAGNIMDPSIRITGAQTAGAGTGEYDHCWTLAMPAVTSFLNITSIGGDAKVGVFPAAAVENFFPSQGFRITSKATLQSGDQQVVKIIETVRSYDHVPGFFDAAIYAEGDIIAN